MKRHSKSRRGCVQCKARHVRELICRKCSEERPVCAACARRRTRCEYGPLLVSFDKRSTTDTRWDQALSSTTLQQASLDSFEGTPGSELSNTERRLLSLYLERAKPPQPSAGKEDIWATEVPARAHQFPLIKHALIALAASHLATYNSDVSPSLGILHRQKAINGIKETLSQLGSQSSPNLEEVEALYMASQALANQTACLKDADAGEFLSVIRGIRDISAMPIMRSSRFQGLCLCLSYRFESRLQTIRQLDFAGKEDAVARVMATAEDSLLQIESICLNKPAGVLIHPALLSWVRTLKSDEENALSTTNQRTSSLSVISEKLENETDATARLMISHWMALEFFFDDSEPFVSRTTFSDEQVIDWILRLCEPLLAHPQLCELARWPACVASTLQQFRMEHSALSQRQVLNVLCDNLEKLEIM